MAPAKKVLISNNLRPESDVWFDMAGSMSNVTKYWSSFPLRPSEGVAVSPVAPGWFKTPGRGWGALLVEIAGELGAWRGEVGRGKAGEVAFRGEHMSKKIWNCLPWNLGYFETVCPGQPENLQNCLSKHKVNIFQAMLKNIIDSHCAFNIKEVNPSSKINESFVLDAENIFLSLRIDCCIFSLT